MSHKAAESEMLPELELVEMDKHSEEKIKKINKDILGLQVESDMVLFRHIPEITHKLENLSSSLLILRDDHADTNRLVRKMYYDQIPSLHSKVDDLNYKVDLLCTKIDELLKK
jgi:hypothetical protein